MIFYKCVTCDVKWSKLTDDGCPSCDSPCQIIEDNQFEATVGGRANGDLSKPSSVDGVLSIGVPRQMSPTLFSSNTDGFTTEEDQEFISAAEPEQDSDLEEREKMECALALLALRYSDNSNTRLNTNAVNINHTRTSGRARSGPRMARFTEVFDTPELSFNSVVGQNGTYESKESATSVNSELPSNYGRNLSIENSDSVQEAKASKEKKKTKKTGNRRRKQSSTVGPPKVLPKLELPDPIPTPAANNSGGGEWSEVVKKGVARAAKKIEKGGKERENVNASSYLARNDEIERPGQDRSAIAVRISMGSAKHDVRRIIPRSALE